MTPLEAIFKKHKNWVNVVKSFGCDEYLADDVVQEMYIKVQQRLNKGLDISYGDDDYNEFYIFKVLRSLFYDLKRKQSKVKLYDLHENTKTTEEEVCYECFEAKVDKAKQELFWYDSQVFDIIDGGYSIARLSRESDISYYSLYNTYRKVKKILTDEIG